MRVYGPNGTAVATAPPPARRSSSGTFVLSDSEPTQAQNAAVALRTLGGIDALIALQGIEQPAERRRRLERRALERYHATLLAHGVGGYGFDALWQDYRYSVLWQCATPVWQAAHKLGPWIWWPNLERVMVAIDDLGCRDLIA